MTELVSDNILVTRLPLREAARGYIISLRASRYSPRYIGSVEMCLRFLADYAEAQGWLPVSEITATHLEEYLVYLQERPRWVGKADHQQKPLSASGVETHYSIRTFFTWL